MGERCAGRRWRGDWDGDSFRDDDEQYIGTSPSDDCADTPLHNDENDDKWPPDFDDSQFVDSTDVLAMKPVFFTAVPPTSARFDIVPNGFIDASDVLALKSFFFLGCN